MNNLRMVKYHFLLDGLVYWGHFYYLILALWNHVSNYSAILQDLVGVTDKEIMCHRAQVYPCRINSKNPWLAKIYGRMAVIV